MHHIVCRDQDDLVTVEAIKALFGQLPPYNPSLMTGATALTPQEELVSNRMRIRAWSMVSSQASDLRFAHFSLQTSTCTPDARLESYRFCEFDHHGYNRYCTDLPSHQALLNAC